MTEVGSSVTVWGYLQAICGIGYR